MKIALIKLGALGDVLRTTCLIAPLRRKYPGAEIWWFTSAAAVPLLERHPELARVVSLTPGQNANLPTTRFDWILGLDEDEQACRLAGDLSGNTRFGAYRDERGQVRYTSDSKPWFDMGLLNRDPDGSLHRANSLKQKNRKTYPVLLFEMLGLPATSDDARPALHPDPLEDREAAAWAERQGIQRDDWLIGLNSGAGSRWTTKQLPIDTTLRMLSIWGQRFPQAKWLLLGGPEETERHQQLLKRSPLPLIDAGTNNSLPRFISRLALSRALITSDSLALHIAVALQISTIAFFSTTSAAEIELGRQGLAWMPKESCRCFYKPTCQQTTFCLESLDPELPAQALHDWRTPRHA